MAKSITEIQRDSDEKRGFKSKSYKLPIEVIEQIAALAVAQGMAQNQVISAAIELYSSKSYQPE